MPPERDHQKRVLRAEHSQADQAAVCVVTRHAVETDCSPEVLIIGSVITRAHGPVAAVFEVPGNGQFDEPAIGGAA